MDEMFYHGNTSSVRQGWLQFMELLILCTVNVLPIEVTEQRENSSVKMCTIIYSKAFSVVCGTESRFSIYTEKYQKGLEVWEAC